MKDGRKEGRTDGRKEGNKEGQKTGGGGGSRFFANDRVCFILPRNPPDDDVLEDGMEGKQGSKGREVKVKVKVKVK